jgi:hypothetical protein
LSVEKDAFNYYLSLNLQVMERAFGILVHRWGTFWRPIRLSMHNCGVAICIGCWLHSVCINDVTCSKVRHVRPGMVPGFEMETDLPARDDVCGLQFMDGADLCRGYRSGLERCDHRDMWTTVILQAGYTLPIFSKFSKKTVRHYVSF